MSMKHIEELVSRYPCLRDNKEEIWEAYKIMEECFLNGNKLLAAGNGGSAADAEHVVGELMKRFRRCRPVGDEFAARLTALDPMRGEYLAKNLERGLMSISLVTHEALSTAYMNDVDALGVFAQQVFGYGKSGDVFFAISTSGNSKNIMYAAVTARALGLKIIGLTGAGGGELAEFADAVIRVPETETFKIQELHLPVYHCLCMMLEDRFFSPEVEES